MRRIDPHSLLDAINQAQQSFINTPSSMAPFESLLESLLRLTDSEWSWKSRSKNWILPKRLKF